VSLDELVFRFMKRPGGRLIPWTGARERSSSHREAAS
jgi:hypothetical protein